MNTSSHGYLALSNELSCEANNSNDRSHVDENSSLADCSGASLKFISQMLMEEEEDLGTKPGMLHDSLALQFTEKSLYDALNNNNNVGENSDEYNFTQTCSSGSSWNTTNFVESGCMGDFGSYFISPDAHLQSNPTSPFWMALNSSSSAHSQFDSLDYEFLDHENLEHNNEKSTQEQRRDEQLANSTVEQTELIEMLDSVLLTYHPMRGDTEKGQSKKNKKQLKGGSNRGRPRGTKRGGIVKDVFDLNSLLMQCAQALAGFDSRAVINLLLQIRQISSPQGDASERLAHYFANALEARLAGTWTASDAEFNYDKLSAMDILKAYRMSITSCPFKNMSHLLANKTIEKLATGAATVHIVNFGILYGYQWPCLIQALSKRPGGPPKLRITGIDNPKPGFYTAERVIDTGRCLAMFCERFGVPFEYNAIGQKWDTIRVEDLKIEKDHELLVVNSLYQLHNVLDETETGTTITTAFSPRDAVLNLIKSINPDMFIHGVINGMYNSPFFISRFREALFHFSSVFDMFDATMPREDPDRLLFEQVYGSDAINIIACEGEERIERPETYKMWHLRSLKAGFRQLPFNPKIISYARSKVKRHYHKDFSVEEDGQWVLHRWKGRVNSAISCWQPAHD